LWRRRKGDYLAGLVCGLNAPAATKKVLQSDRSMRGGTSKRSRDTTPVRGMIDAPRLFQGRFLEAVAREVGVSRAK